MAAPLADASWLAWMERLTGQAARHLRAPDLPRSLFYCRLDDQPDHLLPERYLRQVVWEGSTGRPLFVHPHYFFSHDGELPVDIDTNRFVLQGDMVWIKDAGNGAWLPFWLGPEFAALLSNAQPGAPAPSDLTSEAIGILRMAGVLVSQNHIAERCREWEEITSACRTKFQENGYAPVGLLIHPFHIAALRRYYRCLIRTGELRLGDEQSSLRYVAHNESVARFFHQQLTAAVAAIAGEPVKPSYVYLSSYQSGAVLEKHTDREQCEFSLTMCIDYTPEPRTAAPWPLHLYQPSGMVTVFQGLGDALLYRGRQLPHSRETLPQGHTSTSIFFHYVREDFSGPVN